MNRVFVDTSYFIALVNIQDSFHALAREWARKITQEKIFCHTSVPVLFEIADGFARLSRRATGQSLLQNILASDNYIVHPFSEKIYTSAFDVYLTRKDKEWGLTDCYSFQIMKEHNISRALTADKHFKQFGVQVLLTLK